MIFGDAYLAVDLGSEVDLAGLPVHLLLEPHRDSTSLDSILGNICKQRDRYIAQLAAELTDASDAGRDSLRRLTRDAYDRAWRARNRILEERITRSVGAGSSAQYLLDRVEPGDYRVWADTVIESDHWSWLEEVQVEAGDSLRLNLSNANVDDNPFRCTAVP